MDYYYYYLNPAHSPLWRTIHERLDMLHRTSPPIHGHLGWQNIYTLRKYLQSCDKKTNRGVCCEGKSTKCTMNGTKTVQATNSDHSHHGQGRTIRSEKLPPATNVNDNRRGEVTHGGPPTNNVRHSQGKTLRSKRRPPATKDGNDRRGQRETNKGLREDDNKG